MKPPEVVAKPPEPAAAPAAEAPAANAAGDLNCKEKAPIDDASKQLRRALQYKEKTAEAGKNCKGCAQYEAGKYGDCGACKLFTGAVNPEGHCLSDAPKAG
ncbi:MAG: high-potential iron-sulfur protein [Myxococcales bacterium]|nr:high-potential iron-sulfur protein [Myxococcales bacterium]